MSFNILVNAKSLLFNYRYESILLLLISIYLVYFTVASFARYDNFYTGRFDLGNMDQTVWNTIHGRIFEVTNPNDANNISRLSGHADFILILISPLYLVWPHAKVLLLIQTLIISLGAIFVYLISKEVLRKKSISFIFSIVYLLNPSLQFSNLYDFHAVTFATTFLLAAFYYLIKKRYMVTTIFLVLAGLTKEDIWLITGILGGYIFFVYKKYVLGISVLFISLFTFYFLIWQAIPASGNGRHFALNYYSDFGNSPESVIRNVILSPDRTIATFLGENQLIFLKQILIPLAFLPIFSIFIVFSLPTLFINLLSDNSQLQQIVYQYTAAITPFLFISAIYAIKNLKNLLPKIPISFYVILITLGTLYSVLNYGPLPFSKKAQIDMFTKPLENRKTIDKILSKIPQEYSVSATNDLGSHLSQRQKIYTIPQVANADIVAFLIRKETFSISRKEELQTLEKLKNDKNYVDIFKDGEFILFQKKNLPTLSLPNGPI